VARLRDDHGFPDSGSRSGSFRMRCAIGSMPHATAARPSRLRARTSVGTCRGPSSTSQPARPAPPAAGWCVDSVPPSRPTNLASPAHPRCREARRRRPWGSGWSETEPARGTLTRYQPEIRALDRALRNWQPTAQVKATRKTRNLIPTACSCSPPAGSACRPTTWRRARSRAHTAAEISSRCAKRGLLGALRSDPLQDLSW
jgi:hypothetical protein